MSHTQSPLVTCAPSAAPSAPMTNPGAQRGVALIIGLVILVVLALLGVSAYSVATQDERIAGNARDRARAQEAAETMLRACEYYIQTTKPAFGSGTAGMLAAPTSPPVWVSDTTSPWPSTYGLPNWQTLNPEWKVQPQCLAEGFPLSASDKGPSPAGLPVQQPGSSLWVAHIAARGYGLNPNTQVTLVSYYAFYE